MARRTADSKITGGVGGSSGSAGKTGEREDGGCLEINSSNVCWLQSAIPTSDDNIRTAFRISPSAIFLSILCIVEICDIVFIGRVDSVYGRDWQFRMLSLILRTSDLEVSLSGTRRAE